MRSIFRFVVFTLTIWVGIGMATARTGEAGISGNHTPYLSDKIAQWTFRALHCAINACVLLDVWSMSGETSSSVPL